jgi:hypothetical protein
VSNLKENVQQLEEQLTQERANNQRWQSVVQETEQKEREFDEVCLFVDYY